MGWDRVGLRCWRMRVGDGRVLGAWDLGLGRGESFLGEQGAEN